MNDFKETALRRTILVTDLGTMDYQKCLDLQHRVFEARAKDEIPDCLLLVEHPHVITLGRRAKAENILLSEKALEEKSISCVPVERGGDVTYHGPGQLVGYPILALEPNGLGVTDLVDRLEEIMIRVLGTYGIPSERNERNRGVWVGDAKIGFIGLAVQRGVSFHGFALNVHPDLSYFDTINPCGLQGISVVSVRSILDRIVPLDEVKDQVIGQFAAVMDVMLEKTGKDVLLSILASLDGKGPAPLADSGPVHEVDGIYSAH